MAKEKPDVKVREDGAVVPEVRLPISPVVIDFGRTDINELRDKLNEVIKRV